ncbi:PD-(D/E)XK nuclease-like domain-containing protein [Bradyrhizobium paxllaeri]|uniref:PD-(D/E)XK nuclease-like domain-containing protein n=1 Tax=Bradyrhizobium paxllaeri TaxID=190148 RepID=UPI000827E062|nr:PD-(D/E)XK nuclease-like domain-containing protein [Bradyrhizobium paxllaeri]
MMVIRPWDGKPIKEPGIYSGIPIDVYHGPHICDGFKLSSSGAKTIFYDPAKYWLQSPYNPRRQVKVSTRANSRDEAKRLGRAAHILLLGSEPFSEHYVIHPTELLNPETKRMRKWHGNNPECKAWLKTVPAGIEVLSEDEVEAVRGMAESLGWHPLVADGLLSGEIECSMFWRDPETGHWWSARPDVIPTHSGEFADLKTTSSTEYFNMQRALKDFGYAQQAALVVDGAQTLGLPFEAFVDVFVESEPPHSVATERLKDAAIDLGAKMNRAAMNRFAECIERYGTRDDSRWPGPRGEQQDVEYLDFTERDRTFIVDRLKFEFGIEVAA